MADFKDVFAAPVSQTAAGTRLVTGLLSQRVKLDIPDKIYAYDPNKSALCLLSGKLNDKRTVGNYAYYIMEKDRRTRFTTITNAETIGAVVIRVADARVGAPNSECLNLNTMERFTIGTSAAPWAQWAACTRNIGGSAKPMAVGDKIQIISNAYEENQNVGTPMHVPERLRDNYTQTVRTPFSLSDRDLHSILYGGKDLATEKRWQMVEHAIDVEGAFWWSKMDAILTAVGTAGAYTTFMDGVHSQIGQNVWDVNATPFTERSLVEYMEYAMRYGDGGYSGGRNKTVFASPRVLTEVDLWGREKLVYFEKTKTFGLDVAQFRTGRGSLNFVPHPGFEEKGDIAFMLDMNHATYVKHVGRDTHVELDRGLPGVDGETHEILSDVSIQLEYTAAHSFWRNIPIY